MFFFCCIILDFTNFIQNEWKQLTEENHGVYACDYSRYQKSTQIFDSSKRKKKCFHSGRELSVSMIFFIRLQAPENAKYNEIKWKKKEGKIEHTSQEIEWNAVNKDKIENMYVFSPHRGGSERVSYTA